MRSYVAGLVKDAYSMLGDIPESITIRSRGTASYTASSGAISEAETDTPDIEGLFTKYGSSEVDGINIKNTDVRCRIEKAQLSSVDLTDALLRGGIEYEIVAIGESASNATWVLQLRAVQ